MTTLLKLKLQIGIWPSHLGSAAITGAAGQPMALAVCTKIKGSTRVENYELILLVPFLATDSAVIVWEWARVVQDKL
jgi:hypothetical protein